MPIVRLERKVLEKNEELASINRAMFEQRKIFTINIVSSPGSGKTSILERTLKHLDGRIRTAIIEGDVQTDLDAQRIAKFGIPVVQIVTNGACHLDARFIRDALNQLDLDAVDLLIIENVGNLVCPANFDLGEALKVVVLSTTEGEDKPLKYPSMFHNASVLLINKMDLLPYVNCSLEALKRNAMQINPSLRVFETSCTTGAGIAEWCDWLFAKVYP